MKQVSSRDRLPPVSSAQSQARSLILARVPALVAALGILAAAPAALGSGFGLPEISGAGLGLANALVANPVERGAFAYNPAAMAFHGQSSVAAGILILDPSFSVRNTAGTTDSAGADTFVTPMIQGAARVNDRWSLGLGINAPFGLETRWPINTFPALTRTVPVRAPGLPAGTRIPVSPQPTQSKLEILAFVPTATYRVIPELALAAGMDIYWAKSAQLNSSLTTIEGDGTGYGFNLSALYVKDALSIGLNFHSAAAVAIEGSFQPTNAALLALGRLPPAQGAKLELDLPWRLQAGVRYAINPKVAVELDYNRTGWSEFQRIRVRGARGGAPLVDDANHWEDANAWRLGLTWQVVDNTVLRLGYTYDETGQPDEFFSARVPDNDRQLFGIGLGHRLASGWQIDAGYTYVLFDDRDFRGTRPYLGGAAINGTTALDGRYEANAHLFGIEVSKAFDLF